eukprot:3609947-Rhodomonas_salina.2
MKWPAADGSVTASSSDTQNASHTQNTSVQDSGKLRAEPGSGVGPVWTRTRSKSAPEDGQGRCLETASAGFCRGVQSSVVVKWVCDSVSRVTKWRARREEDERSRREAGAEAVSYTHLRAHETEADL